MLPTPALATHDRSGLERLCRYILHPPLAAARIELLIYHIID